MKPSVCIETTVISYLTSRPNPNVVRQGQIELTQQWWRDRRAEFSLFTSQFVLNEAAAGDPTAAAERFKVLGAIELLEITPEVEGLG